jgi:magnesium transporter
MMSERDDQSSPLSQAASTLGNTASAAASALTEAATHAAATLGTATLQALNGALHPLRAARVVGRLVHRATTKPGAPPGGLELAGPRRVEKVGLRLLEYDGERLEDKEITDVREAFVARDSSLVSWLNVDGLHDAEILARLRDHFGLHLLVAEDVAHVGQRAKLEEYDGFLFLVMPMLHFDDTHQTVEVEQVSLVLGPTWVLTFQERAGDAFDPVRERLRGSHGRIRHRGADYLAYALTDAVVDHYFGILERLGDLAESLEEEVMKDPAPQVLRRITHLRRELLLVRKLVWPLREATGALSRTDSELMTDATQLFVRDVHDHAVRVIETLETLRDLVAGMADLYLSGVGQRANEVIKVLTIMATIFIPLTFLVGVYGMNFEDMPELAIPWAYPALWALMVGVAGVMLWYFRKRRWL